MAANFFWVEFFGGPFDGYVQAFPKSPERLVRTVAFPINANTLLVLNGKPPGPRCDTSSVAYYELFESDGLWSYRFMGAKSPDAWRQSFELMPEQK